MILDKIVSTLVQLAVVLVLYVPLIVGYRLWMRRRANRVFNMGDFKPGLCICGKWETPKSVGIETDVPARASFAPPTSAVFDCPKCGVPIVFPVLSTTLKSRAVAPPKVPVALKRV